MSNPIKSEGEHQHSVPPESVLSGTARGVRVKIPSRDLNPLFVVNAIEDVLRDHGGIGGLEYISILSPDVATHGSVEFSPTAQSALCEIIDGLTQEARKKMNRPDLPPFEVQFE